MTKSKQVPGEISVKSTTYPQSSTAQSLSHFWRTTAACCHICSSKAGSESRESASPHSEKQQLSVIRGDED